MPVYLLWILAGVVALVLDYFVAREFYQIAAIKGWPGKKYFFFAFFFSIAGYIMVAALPDRGTQSGGSFESSDLPEL